MNVNAGTITGLFLALNVRWQQGRESYTPEYPQIGTRETSTTLEEKYVFRSRSPRMQRIMGEKFLSSLRLYEYTLKNSPYAASLVIPREQIEDDLISSFGPQAQDFGLSSAQLPDDLLCNEAFNSMFTMGCFDDQPFIDTDHPLFRSDGSYTTYSNKMTKKLSAASSAAADASIGLALAMMRGFKDEEGAPRGGMLKFRLVVSPKNEQIARKLAQSDYLSNGDANTYKGLFDVYVNRWISDSNLEYWALINIGGPLLPFIYQERIPPKFVYVDNAGNSTTATGGQVSESMFMRQEYIFGNEARCAFGCSLPWLIVASDGTVA